MLKIKERVIEAVFLSILILIFMVLGIGKIFNNTISHSHPQGYLANDVFFHYYFSDSVKLTGGFKHYHPSLVGGFDDIVASVPPIIFLTTNLISNSIGIENYDGIMLITFILYSFIFLLTYSFIKDFFGKKIAIVSVPMFLFVLVLNFNLAITWGRQYNILGFLFLVGFFYIFQKFRFEKPVLLGIVASSLFLSYTEYITYVIMILLVFVVYDLFLNKKKYQIKKIAIAGLTALIISFYYLIIFYNSVLKVQGSGLLPTFKYLSPLVGYRYPLFSQLQWFGLFALIGIVSGLFIFKRKEKVNFATFLLLFISGFGNIVGYGKFLRLRFFWPITLAVFLGLGVYTLLHIIKSIAKLKITSVVCYGISLSLIILFHFTIYVSQPFYLSPGSIVTEEDWDAFKYIDENADKDAKIFLGYGNQFDQGQVPFRTRRLNYYVKTKDWVDGSLSKTIKRLYNTTLRHEGFGSWSYRTSFFTFNYHTKEINKSHYNIKDICKFDYFIFPKIGNPPELIRYNLIFTNLMISTFNQSFDKVFENGRLVVIKNKQRDKDCIPDQIFVGDKL